MADAHDPDLLAAAPPDALDTLALEDVLPCAWRLLAAGARRAREPFHTPVVATRGEHGPSQRTVVLRHVDVERRLLICHTDRRSAKVAELRHAPQVSWLFYDRERKLQLRIAGSGRMHTDDEVADAAWARSAARSRACYGTATAPGSVVGDPPAARTLTAQQEAAARDNFAALSCQVTFLDWLYLCGAGHRRAQFVWQDGHLMTSSWIAP